MMYTRGLGIPASRASSSTIWWSSGACAGVTSWALYILRTILSENQ